MKVKIPLLIISFLLSNLLNAQNRESFFKAIPSVDQNTPEWAVEMYSENPNVYKVDFDYRTYYDSHPFEKNIHTQNYKYWRRFVDDYMNDEGCIVTPSKAQEDAEYKRVLEKHEAVSLNKNLWQNIGPFETYNSIEQGGFPVSWQANVYCFDQSVSNPEIVVAGTEAGGLFKSTDKGLSWFLITPELPVYTINDVKIAPSNPGIIYFGANRRIYKTTDGGDSWSEVFFIDESATQIAVNPVNPDIVFCTAYNGFYKTTDGGQTWTQIFPDKSWDVCFHPTNPDVVYMTKHNSSEVRSEFYRSTDGGETFELKDNGWYVPADPAHASDIGSRIGVTPAQPDLIYIPLIGESKEGDNGWIGIYKSADMGDSWSNPNPPDGGPYNTTTHPNLASINPNGTGFHQGFFNFAVAVSYFDPDRLWIGCLALSQSDDGGVSSVRIGSYNAGNNDIGWIHPDIQDLHTLGDDVWVCCDGGINYSDDQLQTHESRKSGIYGSDFWGFGSGWNEDVLVGGRYHNGNGGYYQTYGTGNFLRLGGAEAPTGYVDPLYNRKAYFSDINTWILPDELMGEVVQKAKLGLYPNESYSSNNSSEIEFHPAYAGHMYLGNGNGFWKSTTGGTGFTLLHEFGYGYYVTEIEISRSNPEVIYAAVVTSGYYGKTKIYRSEDGGYNWEAATNVPTNNRKRLEITLNPADKNDLWVACPQGSNGKKVYRTTDGGETWMNLSTDLLDDERCMDILYQAGTGDVVYLSTNHSVYYWNSSDSEWVDYSGGLPFETRALEMRPFYRDGKLRLACTGRGIYETDLVAESEVIARPLTFTDSVYCIDDTVQFDSYSVIRNEGAEWQWSFNPEPQYVSSYTARNPKVWFGEEGAYDVTLTVKDANDNTDTKTIQDMVVVGNAGITVDSIAGKALTCYENGDYATTEEFNIMTNTFTITAWIKPDGIQNDYTGIVINNGETGGFNLKSGNMLAYHWPGGSWGWNSNIYVQADEWSYVAMVATPAGMTVYVNGESKTHTANLNVIEITSLDIGSYKGWGGRNFKGQIDEVCMWNRSLTQDEVRMYRHITKEELIYNDPDFIAYYQFNRNVLIEHNKAGCINAALTGNATREFSTVPVGKGTVQMKSVSGGGEYDFEETGFRIKFPVLGIFPEGDIYVTRIGTYPSTLPVYNPGTGCYWIVNNYGENSDFTTAEEVGFSATWGVPTAGIIENPELAVLYERPENSELDWMEKGGAFEVTPGSNGYFKYNSSCGIGNFGQFVLVSDDPETKLLDGILTGGNDKPDNPFRVAIYPNPVSRKNKLNVVYDGEEELRFTLFSSDGKVVKDVFLKGPSVWKIDLGIAESGLYFYTIKGKTFIQNGKMIVE